MTLSRSQTKPAAFGCSKQATLLAGAGGKVLHPIFHRKLKSSTSADPSGVEGLACYQAPSIQVIHQESRGMRAEQESQTWWLAAPCPYSRIRGNGSLWQGQSPQLDTPGQRQRLFGPEVKAGTTLEAQKCPGMEGTFQGGEEPRNV